MLPLEPALVLGREPVEMMEQHPVEDRALRMPGTTDSRQGGKKALKERANITGRTASPRKNRMKPGS